MASRKPASRPVSLLVATRKGAFFLKADASRRQWKLSAPIMLGQIAHHLVQDPRDPRVILFSARTGHLGPTMFRSVDRGRSWQEARRPPAFPKAVAEGAKQHVLDHIFWLTPGHASQPGTAVDVGQLHDAVVPAVIRALGDDWWTWSLPQGQRLEVLG